MAKEERILAIDIGATSIKLCEFQFGRNNQIILQQFAHREYEEELSEGTRINVVSGLLRQMLAEGGFRAKKALVSLSGQSALMRFSRLPPMLKPDPKQISKLAEFEATNNIPFPVDQVLWDYQLVVGEETDQIDVLSVVIKNEVVDQFTQAVMSVGCDPIHVDVAPVACFNACRAAGVGSDGCTIILNIGGRNTSLLFAEGERVFARSIPTAGHSITQQIAKEFNIGLPEAEELKRRHGFVALGGAYAEPESETAANVSKIIRTVMARLHGEIARSINVYKSQQKGSAPVKMYLTGGSSILNYCDTFFQEKLGIPVEYLNPFTVTTFAPTIDRASLQDVAHMFSETVGLAVRYNQDCPIEIDLCPRSILRQQALQAKKPCLFAAGIAVVATLGILHYGLLNSTATYERAANNLNSATSYKADLDELEGKIGKSSQYKSSNDEMEQELMKKCLLPNIYHEIAQLRPDHLNIISITPVYEEELLDQTSEDEDEMLGTGMGMDGMMDSGSPSAMDMSGSPEGGMDAMAAMDVEPYTTIERIVYGFEITGFSYMPNTSGGLEWTPTLDKWTDFSSIIELPTAEGEEAAAPQASDEVSEDNSSEDNAEANAEEDKDEEKSDEEKDKEDTEKVAEEDADKEKEAPEQPAESAEAEKTAEDAEKPALSSVELAQKSYDKIHERMLTMTTPDQAFMEALLSSPLFDPSVNPKHAFVSKRVYTYPKKGNNRDKYSMNWFKIKVKLVENARISYNEYKSLNKSNRGMDGGMMMR